MHGVDDDCHGRGYPWWAVVAGCCFRWMVGNQRRHDVKFRCGEPGMKHVMVAFVADSVQGRTNSICSFSPEGSQRQLKQRRTGSHRQYEGVSLLNHAVRQLVRWLTRSFNHSFTHFQIYYRSEQSFCRSRHSHLLVGFLILVLIFMFGVFRTVPIDLILSSNPLSRCIIVPCL